MKNRMVVAAAVTAMSFLAGIAIANYSPAGSWDIVRVVRHAIAARFARPLPRASSVRPAFVSLPYGQGEYFPKNVFQDDSWGDQFLASWYAHELEVLEEPSLLEMAKNPVCESYRFLWLRTFHNPVAVRLDVRDDGIGVITTKVASGASGFPRKDVHLIESMSRPLTPDETRAFLLQVGKGSFWSLASHVEDRTGMDGSEWIIEGAKDGKYHVVTRWSPDEGEIHELGLVMAFGMAQMSVPKEDIY